MSSQLEQLGSALGKQYLSFYIFSSSNNANKKKTVSILYHLMYILIYQIDVHYLLIIIISQFKKLLYAIQGIATQGVWGNLGALT